MFMLVRYKLPGNGTHNNNMFEKYLKQNISYGIIILEYY